MKIEVAEQQINQFKTQAIVILIFEEDCKNKNKIEALDKYVDGKISKLIDKGEISAKFKEYTYLRVNNLPCENILIMGLGKQKDFTLDKIRATIAVSSRYLRRIKIEEFAVPIFTEMNVDIKNSACAVVEGMILGLYKFWKYLTDKDPNFLKIKKLTILANKKSEVPQIKEGIDKGYILSMTANFVRDLINEPANKLNPEIFSQIAQEKAKEHKLGIKVFLEKDLEKLGTNGILAVGKGSCQAPCMVMMEYKGKKGGKTIGLIGKGITFDSGGINLKPTEGLAKMHCDMAGASVVMGVMIAAAKLKPNINIIGLMPLAENMPGPCSTKPGDIVKMFTGKTVEISNTDAEGRLLLADALGYAVSKKVDMLIDIATLTGAILITFGRFVAGMFGNDKNLSKALFEAGENAGERVWELPLYPEYKAQLRSTVADLNNSGGREAGSITAGWFLAEFVNSIPWMHIDIAGTSTMEKTIMPYLRNPYLPKEGATGFGFRLLYYTMERLADSK